MFWKNFGAEYQKNGTGGHQVINRTLQNARQSVYWHGITRDFEIMCKSCKRCQRMQPLSQKETMEADNLPERPFYVVSSDLFYSVWSYLIVCDLTILVVEG